MIQSVAVTTDFSDLSREAFPVAASVARTFGADVALLHVVPSPEAVTSWQVVDESEQEEHQVALQKQLEDLAASTPSFEGLRVRARALLGNPGAAFRRYRQEEGFDLLVVASHGHTGIDHFLLGSFAAKVLQAVPCPTLVFRVTSGNQTAARTEFRPRRILAPHDFSRASAESLELAREWARRFDAKTRILFVADPTPHGTAFEGRAESEGSTYLEQLRDEGKDRLLRLILERWQGLDAEGVARIGHPAIEILEETDEFGADLIIMASRGLSVVESLHLGRVADRTIHHASSPVLIVKSKAEEANVAG